MLYDRKQNLMSLLNITEQESLIIKLVNNFLESNPKIGYVVFHVFYESPTEGMLPIPNAIVTVSKHLGEGNFVSRILITNAEGKTDPIPLPTVQAKPSAAPGNEKVYSTYNARIEAPNFLTTDVLDFQVFDSTTSVQTIVLSPGTNNEIHQIYKSKPQPLSILTHLLYSTQQISEFIKLLQDYLEENPKTGYIVFQVFQESAIKGRIPVANAIVTVSKYIGNGYVVSKVAFTDSDGKTDPIPFFTTDKKYSMAPGSNNAYATYSARIESPDFITTDIFDIQIFDGITGIQSVILSPK